MIIRDYRSKLWDGWHLNCLIIFRLFQLHSIWQWEEYPRDWLIWYDLQTHRVADQSFILQRIIYRLHIQHDLIIEFTPSNATVTFTVYLEYIVWNDSFHRQLVHQRLLSSEKWLFISVSTNVTCSFWIYVSLYYFDQLFNVGFKSVWWDKRVKARVPARRGNETKK